MATTTRLSDPRLGAVIDAIEANGWAAELYDPKWRLLWLSSELLAIVGAEPAAGRAVRAALRRDPRAAAARRAS